MTQPCLMNLHLDEYSQNFHYDAFAVKLGRYVGICNTLSDLSNKVCAASKTKDLNLSVLNMTMGINEAKH